MRTRFIYICSPCRGDMEKNITKAQNYCREAVELFPDVVPIAPHVYCTQFMDDTNPKERALGMELGISLLSMCSEIWVYGIDNPSESMKAEIEYAKDHGILVRDAVEVYQHTGEELPDAELGDALIVLLSRRQPERDRGRGVHHREDLRRGRHGTGERAQEAPRPRHNTGGRSGATQ